jgi:hypothetical protein
MRCLVERSSPRVSREALSTVAGLPRVAAQDSQRHESRQSGGAYERVRQTLRTEGDERWTEPGIG